MALRRVMAKEAVAINKNKVQFVWKQSLQPFTPEAKWIGREVKVLFTPVMKTNIVSASVLCIKCSAGEATI